MVFHTVPNIVQRLFPKRIWSRSPEKNQIYLTFDDGPVPGITDYVLNELAKRNMKATFFMVGDNVGKHPLLAREVCSENHVVANHTFHHLNGWKTKKQEYLNDFLECDRMIQQVLGKQTCLFRPPYGLLTSSQAKEILKTHSIIMWNMLSGDYDLSLNTQDILQKSIEKTTPGSVVLFHDQQKTSSVLPKILPTYLDEIQDQGWETATL
ncbi:polysaccharide deacetylase family protein [Algoriphagus sp.]|uniref:polysaccharide deacetylase family protein n=1 Tax=Algoriphagus sp. TaxID=1872435 RepID=UPI0025FE3726|nr:polysaccharide deacetylase family protein [Algoriphagus sp.]